VATHTASIVYLLCIQIIIFWSPFSEVFAVSVLSGGRLLEVNTCRLGCCCTLVVMRRHYSQSCFLGLPE
jgi:hypothetical protein